jgi:hypothetical protein
MTLVESSEYCRSQAEYDTVYWDTTILPFFDKMEPPRQDQATHQDKVRAPPFGIIRIWPWSNLANMARSNHPNIARSQSEYDAAYIRMTYRPNISRSYNPYRLRSDHLRSGRPNHPNTKSYHTKVALTNHLSNLASKVIRKPGQIIRIWPRWIQLTCHDSN